MSEAKFPKRTAKMNPHITEIVHVNSLSERLESLADSDGFVFFTGGIGTLAEFAFIWHSLQVAADFTRPVILVSPGWKHLLAEIKQVQMIKHQYYRIVHLCERVEEAVAIVTNDYSIKYDDPDVMFCKECIVFDLDGTIVESPEEEFIKLCENIGYFFQLPKVIEAFRKARLVRSSPQNMTSTLEGISFHGHVLENLGLCARSAAEIAPYVCKGLEQIPDLYADVTDTLHHFKESGFATGVISSRHPLELEEILSIHKVSGLFDFVKSRHHSAETPNMGLFDEAVRVSGFRKDDIVIVEDDLQDDYPVPGAVDADSILLDRHLAYIPNSREFKIRSLRELKYLVKHRGTSLPSR
jgi:phosphoglycolate phosphatase-like HAD superfamily hydrolase